MREEIIKQHVGATLCVLKYDYYVKGVVDFKIEKKDSNRLKYIATLQDGRIAYTPSNKYVIIMDLNTQKKAYLRKTDCVIYITHVGILYNGYIIGIRYKTLYIWNPNNLSDVDYTCTFDINAEVYKVFILQSTFITIRQTAYGDSHLQEWNLKGECIFEYRKRNLITGVIKMSETIVVGFDTGHIRLLSPKIVKLEGYSDGITDLKIIDQNTFITSNYNRILIWNYTGICIDVIPITQAEIMILKDGVFGTITKQGVKVWNLKGECIREIQGTISNMALLPNNDIITLSEDGRIRIWNEEGVKKEWLTEVNSRLIISGTKIMTTHKNTLSVWK